MLPLLSSSLFSAVFGMTSSLLYLFYMLLFYMFYLNQWSIEKSHSTFTMEVRLHTHHPPQTPLVKLHRICCCVLQGHKDKLEFSKEILEVDFQSLLKTITSPCTFSSLSVSQNLTKEETGISIKKKKTYAPNPESLHIQTRAY